MPEDNQDPKIIKEKEQFLDAIRAEKYKYKIFEAYEEIGLYT